MNEIFLLKRPPMNLPPVERGSVTRSGPGLAEVLRVTDPRSGSGEQIMRRGGAWNLSHIALQKKLRSASCEKLGANHFPLSRLSRGGDFDVFRLQVDNFVRNQICDT